MPPRRPTSCACRPTASSSSAPRSRYDAPTLPLVAAPRGGVAGFGTARRPAGRDAMRLLFVADPLETFKTYKDTTYAMMREAEGRGHALVACEPRDLVWQRGG